MVLKKASAMSLENAPEHPYDGKGLREWLETLESQDPAARRLAARELKEFSVAAPALINALAREPNVRVKGAILVSLQYIGGARVFEGLVPFLRSEDVGLRNGIIEILQGMPEEVSKHISSLLHDDDSDVRIFAIDILQTLAHPDTPLWLMDVIKNDEHVNVVATAIDRLIEVGNPEHLPAIEQVKVRFPNEPYISFIVDLALQRLKGG
ncbi:HEAT repeat domain-containing protein [Rhodanobacter aciditrophus]|uniref:HEAT repeat domain-containing protein n=1 Tax=Rhodanobacter aciditrophus TaxID=1623218 RepID=A0ABW4B8L6_9GAMM